MASPREVSWGFGGPKRGDSRATSPEMKVAGQEGLEPPTRGFGVRCSTIRAIALKARPAMADRAYFKKRPIECGYFVSLWFWCLRQRGQNFESSSFSAFARLFFVVV